MPRNGLLWAVPALLALLPLGLASAPAQAGDAAAGAEKAVNCRQCHGREGISLQPDVPNIAGQKEYYLVQSMKAYRDGTRKSDMMTFIAETLSDEDIADLAAYFSGFEISVTVPGE